MQVCLVVGTRPEIIKMTPVIKVLREQKIKHFVIHSGQHYDDNMNGVFLKQLGWEGVDIEHLEVESNSYSTAVGKIMMAAERILQERKPDIVLVLGDTNTALAGALAAVGLGIPVGHIEAGLRNFDRRNIEEYNRIMISHIADYLFAPTDMAMKNLLDEGLARCDLLYYDGVRRERVALVGNTVVDALTQSKEIASNSDIFSKLNIEKSKYILVTIHRAENVDNEDYVRGMIEGVRQVQEKYNLPVVYPMHPRTKKRLTAFGIYNNMASIPRMCLIEPLGFFDFIALEMFAAVILTDSGGIQEEACSLGVPCVVLRERSDRPESLAVGASVLAGNDPKRIVQAVAEIINKNRNWKKPYGSGLAAKEIVKILMKNFS